MKWINVKKQLPKNSDDVLVYISALDKIFIAKYWDQNSTKVEYWKNQTFGMWDIREYSSELNRYDAEEDDNEYENSEITHWCPITKPKDNKILSVLKNYLTLGSD